MIEDDEFDILALKYIDGTLSPSELARLNEHLRASSSARERLTQIATQAVVLADISRMQPRKSARPPEPSPFSSYRSAWFKAAAALLVLTAGIAVFWTGRQGESVVLVECVGGANWYGASDEMRSGLIAGMRLTDGTLALDGEASSAQIRFADGTQITLSGGTELTYSSDGQKRLHLKSGTITATVAPQPNGKPMRIRTAMAEIEVLGTVLELSAKPDQTLLIVQKGLVRLRRMADGREIQVPANSAASASLDTRAELLVSKQDVTTREWRQVFHVAPDENWKGQWRAADGKSPGRMGAVPYIAGRKRDGGVITHHGITARTFSVRTGQPAVLASASSMLHLRWRTAVPSQIQVMLLTDNLSGGFGGNFEYSIMASQVSAGADGWHHAKVPLKDFSTVTPETATEPAGTKVMTVLVSSYGTDVQLEIAEIGILQP